jgi:hypothetical protein
MRIPRSEAKKYGETKQRVQVMLTPTASEKLDKIADRLGISRSETLERLLRKDREVLKEL